LQELREKQRQEYEENKRVHMQEAEKLQQRKDEELQRRKEMVCIFCNIAVCSHKICTISAQDIT
jgi:hypothetical protein